MHISNDSTAHTEKSCFHSISSTTFSEVREATYWWRNDYNELRPHDSFGNMMPAEYMENYTRNSTLELST